MRRRHIAVVLIPAAALLISMACSSSTNNSSSEADMQRAVELSKAVTTLEIDDMTVGTGAEATPGRGARCTTRAR